jgi:hypothetical protein
MSLIKSVGAVTIIGNNSSSVNIMLTADCGSKNTSMISLSVKGDIPADSLHSTRSQQRVRQASSCSLFRSQQQPYHGKPSSATTATSSEADNTPLRQRLSSDVSWLSSDDEDESDDDDVDLLPAIRRTILNASDANLDESDSSSSMHQRHQQSVNGPQLKFSFGRLDHDEDDSASDYDNDDLSILQDTSTNKDGACVDGSLSSQQSVVTFSVEPPQVFSYTSPALMYHEDLYYGPNEMQAMLNDYLDEYVTATES